MNRQSWRTRSVAVVLCALLFATQLVAVAGAPDLPDPGQAAISREDQEKLGLQAMAEVYKQMPVLPDSSPETQYIQALGRKLTATIPAEVSWPWQFHVIPQKEINAFALPGGPMFINIGTITAASNESELAGVMAHEMAHVYMQHSAKQAQKGSLLQGLAGLAGAVLGGGGGLWGTLAQAGIQFGAGTLMMKYSRGDESQADAVGAIILWKAGYNPMGMADFFRKLAAEGGGRGPEFLSGHPNPGNRESGIRKQIQGWPSKRYQTNSTAFQNARASALKVRSYTAQEIAAGAKGGQWEQQNRQTNAIPKGLPASNTQTGSAVGNTGGQIRGVSLPDVAPSGNFRILNGGAFQLRHPDNWEVLSDKQQQSFTIAPQAGVSNGAIAYGVVIGGFAPQQRGNLDQATRQLLASMEQNQGVRAVGSPETIRVNGLQGKSVDLSGESPITDQSGRPARERDWLVTVQRNDGSLLYLVFVSPEQDFAKLRPTFEEMLRSLRMQ